MTSLRLCAVVLFLFGLSTLALAQDTGAITGTVHDQSGAIVPGAEIRITSAGFNRTTTSNSDGDYLAAAVPGGTYDVSVSAKGFKTFSAKGVILRVGQKARVDATLAPGAVETVVEVQGQNLNQVETQSSELAGVVTGKQMTQLELNGRNFTSLIQLTPGATNQSGSDEPGTGLATVAYSVNGGRTEYNNYQVDGGSNQDDGSNTTLQVYPSLDSIAEFRVLTSNYGAQYGRNGSGTVELETKSGTGSFHGDVYEFVRNDDFNARNFFQSSVPAYKKNDYGYTIGGPIYIPGHYNKDKTKSFFFWSEEWRKDIVPQNFSVPVPSLAERGCTSATAGCVGTVGNFSDLCPNPSTGSMADCPLIPAGQPNAGQQFPGNLVPISPQAMPLVQMISLPNGGSPGAFTFQGSPSAPTNWREELIRLDHNINDKNRLSFHFIHDSWNNVFLTPTWTNGANFPTITNDFIEPGVSLVTHLTTVASPTLLNEFVFAYSADHITTLAHGFWQRPSNLATFGFPGFPNGGRLPGIQLNGGIYGGLVQDPGWVPNGPVNSNPQYEYRDNISKIFGKHNFQFGGYLLASQKNELPQFEPSINGNLVFDTSSTVTTGNAFADLLQGDISTFQQASSQVKYHLRYKIFEPYFQDDWHVTSKLTLNLGLRLSFLGTVSEANHIGFNFDPGAYDKSSAPQIGPTGALVNGVGNPFDGIVQCGGPGGTGFIPAPYLAAFPAASVGKASDSCMKGHLFNPAPRLGFAFDPTGSGHTAIRGGYGIFWEHTNGNEATATQLEGSPPLAVTPSQSTIGAVLSSTGSLVTPGYNFVGAPGTFFPLTMISIPQKAVWPYVQQWHFDIQHDFWKNTVATVSYVGSKGTHLGRRIDLNQLFPVPASANPYKVGEAIGPNDCATGTTPSGVPIPGAAALNGGSPVLGTPGVNFFVACGNSADPFRPFLGYSDIKRLEDAASSNYNALQTSVRRNVGGLQFSFAYTYSHSIDDSSSGGDGSFVNTYNPAFSRSSSNFDQRHVFNISYIYDLPFFKNPGIAHTILGGWQYSGITTIETGTPFSVVNGGGGSVPGDNAGVGNGVGTGSLVDVLSSPAGSVDTSVVGGCGPNSNIACFGPLFANPTLFVAPQGLTFGDSGRNRLRNPRQTNFDMGLFKHFPIHESIGLEFRAEAFNVFNHTEFGYIGGQTGSAANNSGITAFSNTAGCYGPTLANNAGDPSCLSGGFLRPAGAHNARILQLGMKLLF